MGRNKKILPLYSQDFDGWLVCRAWGSLRVMMAAFRFPVVHEG